MQELKKISAESIARATSKAERYRLLNEPRSAESICRDVLAVDPNRQDVLRILVLALTDQFKGLSVRKGEALQLLERLEDEYSRAYYSGVIHERWAKALLDADYPASTVYDCLAEAMDAYERAIPLAESGNEDATLRWNTCVRIIARHNLARVGADISDQMLEQFDDEVPFREA